MNSRYHRLNIYDHAAKMIYHECLNIMFDMLMMIDFSVSCINFLKCNVNEFVHWNYNDAQIRMITYLCHDLEIDVKGFSLLFDNDKGGDRLLAQFKKKAKITKEKKLLSWTLPIIASLKCQENAKTCLFSCTSKEKMQM